MAGPSHDLFVGSARLDEIWDGSGGQELDLSAGDSMSDDEYFLFIQAALSRFRWSVFLKSTSYKNIMEAMFLRQQYNHYMETSRPLRCEWLMREIDIRLVPASHAIVLRMDAFSISFAVLLVALSVGTYNSLF